MGDKWQRGGSVEQGGVVQRVQDQARYLLSTASVEDSWYLEAELSPSRPGTATSGQGDESPVDG